MGNYTNDCRYCKYKYKFKFSYRTWQEIALYLYETSVKRFSTVKSITFMYNSKPWMIDDSCDELYEINECLHIPLVEPMTYQQAEAKGCGSGDFHWPDEDPCSDDDLKLLQSISKHDSQLDLSIDVYDVFGDDKHHYCGVTKITGEEDVKIWLKEAWNCED